MLRLRLVTTYSMYIYIINWTLAREYRLWILYKLLPRVVNKPGDKTTTTGLRCPTLTDVQQSDTAKRTRGVGSSGDWDENPTSHRLKPEVQSTVQRDEQKSRNTQIETTLSFIRHRHWYIIIRQYKATIYTHHVRLGRFLLFRLDCIIYNNNGYNTTLQIHPMIRRERWRPDSTPTSV